MADILDRILESKRREVERRRSEVPTAELERRLALVTPPRGFERALRSHVADGRPAVIAEIKRASPSRGTIRRENFDPAAIAVSYERHGAACLSVLTDSEYFGGSREDLIAARGACHLPVLRKDFIVDAYQLLETRSWGADCVLLIVGAMPYAELGRLERVARGLALDVLVECHDGEQLERALSVTTSPLIGVNNRDLRTFETRLETTLELLDRIPPGRLLITESGIHGPGDVARLQSAGVSAYLVGSAFMAAEDPGLELKRIFSTG
jgi:indole-3-glycerol phosphate synthase